MAPSMKLLVWIALSVLAWFALFALGALAWKLIALITP